MLPLHPIFEMEILKNYSIEFGVLMRAVCPTVSGLVG
jgi:hypothetical protein